MAFFARLLGLAWPQPPKTPFAAGNAARERGRFDEAMTCFTTALESAATAGDRALIHNARALTFLGRGDIHAAVDALVAALDADPRCVPALVNVGNLLLEDRSFDEAIVHYEAALRIDDGYAAAHLNLGIAYKTLGRRADAVREFRRANRLEASSRPRRASFRPSRR